MILETDLQAANEILKSWVNADVQISIFSLTHRRLALKFSRPNEAEVVYLLGVGCRKISGQFDFKNQNLQIFQVASENGLDSVTKIKDDLAGFELVTAGGFALAKGLASEFTNSLESFFRE